MGEFVVRGGRRLNGTVRINGAKNAALPIMAAAILADEPLVVTGVPDLRDVRVMQRVLEALGVRVERWGTTLRLDPRPLQGYAVPAELMQEMRASVFVMGPLLARLGVATIVQPGGCAIGDRPIDLHLKGFAALGAEVREVDGATLVRAHGRLRGGEIHLSYPSVGATENLMMAAALAQGETRIRNAAMEPEIVDLAQCLEQMGCPVRGAGTREIRIIGQDRLGGGEHPVIPDRIETATFALAVAAAGGTLRLEHCLPAHLPGFWTKLEEVGVEVEEVDAETVVVRAPDHYPATGTAVATHPYPGFATDIQPQWMAFVTRVPGLHIITERVFENRLGHAQELRRMGAHILVDQRTAVVRGGTPLHGAAVRAIDLRAGAALVIAALGAEGETRISGREVIERGYERLDQRLGQVGADIAAE
ncbi:MAG: UDP-N-acetylglucosamine 1-carboxyvinyltransferase [Firmicutes bacterium]|nr:UDP-N-acetylglucosamine 1-carboxyvinyltransferase [Alicyclobacillaceae bacterium]MCL6497781.1 UDP-N-acetylglucosamine 1-carboxyvinyltransferase [Bacillota bacterium]